MRAPSRLAARRAVIRWAVRLFRREWRQQVLVLSLLTVAVGAAVFAATAAYNAAPSRDADFGTADHRFEVNVSEPEVLAPYLAAAEEWFGTVDVIGHRSVPVPGSIDSVEIRNQDPRGPYGSPMVALREGRYPTAAGELALTDRVAATFGVGVDDTVVLDGTERTAVGLVENPGDLDDEFALVAPAPNESPDAVTVLVRASEDRVRSFTFADDPGTGFVESRGQTEKATAAAVVLAVAAVAMLLVGLVAAAGFVVLAQRRLRQLGMLAAVGATERHLRLVMVANGAAVGVVAAVVGTAVALAGWAAFAPTFEEAAGHRIDGFDVPGWLIVAGFVLAVGTATAAAWWPARSVARVPVVHALSARPPPPKAAHRSALVAVLLLVVGVAGLALGNDPTRDETQPLLFLPGMVSTVAAVVIMAPPAISALASFAGRLPVAVRLPVRDLARYKARSGAALAAITLGLAIAVSVVVVAAAAEYGADEGNLSDRQLVFWVGDSRPDLYVPDRHPADLAELRSTVDEFVRTLDGPALVPLEVAVDPTIAESRGLERVRPAVVLGRPVGETTLRDAGLVYVATPELLHHLDIDQATIGPETILLTHESDDVYLTGNTSDTTFRRNPVPAEAVAPITDPGYSSVPRSLLTDHGLGVGEWQPTTAGWLVETARPLTEAQLAAARDVAADADLTTESRDHQSGLETTRTGATSAGVVLALGILAMTVGLIRGETARDLRTLTATGATSRTCRALTASTAGALAGLATVLGVVVAYLALTAGYWPDTGRLANVPVAHLTAIAVGLPLLSTVAGWMLTGREPAELSRQAID